MLSSTSRIAWRNLGRNRRRTALALVAIAVAQMSVLMMDGLMNGWVEGTLQAATGPMLGHVQVHAPDWREERAPDLVIDDLEQTLGAIRAHQGVHSAFARIYAPALVAREVDGRAALIVGVDIEAESASGGLLAGLPPEGRPAPGRVLVGSILAREEGLQVGDELAIMGAAADGSIANDLVVVTGILDTRIDQINRSGIVMPLATAQEVFAMPDQASEITIRGAGMDAAGDLATELAALPRLAGMEVLPWRTLAPEIAAMLDISGYYGLAALLIVFLAAAVGVANTMLMATFERRRELGMLLALGTTPARLVRMVLGEAVVLGVLGVFAGSVFGAILLAYFHRVGIDMTQTATGRETDMAMYGIDFSGAIYPWVDAGDFVPGFVGVVVVSVLAALWPAIHTARTEPVKAMRS